MEFLLQAYIQIAIKIVRNISNKHLLELIPFMGNTCTIFQILLMDNPKIWSKLFHKESRTLKNNSKQIFITRINRWLLNINLWTHPWCINQRKSQISNYKQTPNQPLKNRLRKKLLNLHKARPIKLSKLFSQFITLMSIILNLLIWIKEDLKNQILIIRACIPIK